MNKRGDRPRSTSLIPGKSNLPLTTRSNGKRPRFRHAGLFAVPAAFILALSLFGCGGGSEDAQKEFNAMRTRLDQVEQRLTAQESRPQETPLMDSQVAELRQTVTGLQETVNALRDEQASLAKRMQSYEAKGEQSAAQPKKAAPEPKKASSSGESPRTYTVKPGDTLYRIAANHNLTLEEIHRLNNMTDNVIRPGQKLIVAPKK